MSNQKYAEDEIDLRDYIKVILKRKKLILTVFFVTVITTAVVSLCMPKVYESASMIQVGSIDELLMKKEEVREILLAQNLLAPIIKELNLDIDAKQLKENIKIEDTKGTNSLKIKVQYPNSDMVVKINKGIVSSFVSSGQGIYQERIGLINERLKELQEEEIKNTEEDIGRVKSLISEMAGSTGISHGISQKEISLRIILLQNTLPNYQSHLYTLKNRRNQLKVLLSKAEEFKIVDSPIEPKYPIKPKKRRMVAISIIISLIVGVFLAFFMEYWQASKKT